MEGAGDKEENEEEERQGGRKGGWKGMEQLGRVSWDSVGEIQEGRGRNGVGRRGKRGQEIGQ